jgi:4-hydroxyphenylacetate 3-monooxygenase
LPLRPGNEDYAISCVVPNGAPGLKLYPRRPYALGLTSVFDYPLSSLASNLGMQPPAFGRG